MEDALTLTQAPLSVRRGHTGDGRAQGLAQVGRSRSLLVRPYGRTGAHTTGQLRRGGLRRGAPHHAALVSKPTTACVSPDLRILFLTRTGDVPTNDHTPSLPPPEPSMQSNPTNQQRILPRGVRSRACS